MKNNEDKYVEEVKYTSKNKMTQDSGGRKGKKPEKSNYMVFLIVTVFVGIVVCILAMVIAFQFVLKPAEKNLIQDKPTTQVPTTTSVATTQETNNAAVVAKVGVVKTFNPMEGKMEVRELNQGGSLYLTLDQNTVLNDAYGQKVSMQSVAVGDVVSIEIDETKNLIVTLRQSPEAWNKQMIKGVTVSANGMVVNNEQFTFDPQMVTLYKGQPYDVQKISPDDFVTLKGFRNTLLYVEVMKGHGTIQIINKDKVKDATLEIDKATFTSVSEAQEYYEVSEGAHRVMVTGANIETYIQEINVAEGATQVVDLSNVKSKSGILTVTVNESNAILYINGTQQSLEEPIPLTYGTYKLRVEKDGFEPQEKSVVVSDAFAKADFKLQKVVKLQKISINTEPAGADIYIDGVLVGQSPIKQSLEYGYHTIIVRKEGYLEVNAPLTITEDKDTYNIILQADTHPTLSPENVQQ